MIAIKLTAVPSSEKRRYEDRGWTLFESILIDGKSPAEEIGGYVEHTNSAKFNVITLGDDFQPGTETSQPASPHPIF